jgi:poly [ADP-ribose] polymerase
VWTRWGRVGEAGQNALIREGNFGTAFRTFGKKFKDKSGLKWDDRLQPAIQGKYAFIERNYEPDSQGDDDNDTKKKDEPSGSNGKGKEVVKVEIKPSELPDQVQRLMELIFNAQFFQDVMAEMEYDAERLPLGKLSKRTLEAGYQALKVAFQRSASASALLMESLLGPLNPHTESRSSQPSGTHS